MEISKNRKCESKFERIQLGYLNIRLDYRFKIFGPSEWQSLCHKWSILNSEMWEISRENLKFIFFSKPIISPGSAVEITDDHRYWVWSLTLSLSAYFQGDGKHDISMKALFLITNCYPSDLHVNISYELQTACYIMEVLQLTLTSLAPSLHWELIMIMLWLNALIAPVMPMLIVGLSLLFDRIKLLRHKFQLHIRA